MYRPNGPRRLAAAALLVSAFTAGPVGASSFQVDPVLVEVAPGKTSAILTVENFDDAPLSIRTGVLSWAQPDGTDVHGPTSAILLSPPIANIPAHSKQILRVGPRLRDPSREEAYRVIVQEVPDRAPGDLSIRMAVRFDVPLYIEPARKAPAELGWSAWRTNGGDLVVEARNPGNVRADLDAVGVTAGGAAPVFVKGRVGPVLAGGRKRWTIAKTAGAPAGSNVTLLLRTKAGETQVPLAIRAG